MEKLFSVLSSIVTLTPAARESIAALIVPLSLPENHLLLEAPRVADQIYFLEKGFAVSYSFYKGKVQVENFWNEGSIIFAAKSFIEQSPSRDFIRLALPSDVLCMSYSHVHSILEVHPETRHIYHIIMSQYYERSRERVHDLHHLTTMERFEKLLKKFPRIEQYVSQEYIASYLGIAPPSLSRLKREHDRS